MLDACPNFRDVGLTINIFAGHTLLREQQLYRGGKIDFVDDPKHIGAPNFIINLRRGPDPDLGVPTVQLAADDRLENYKTADPAVRRWLERVLDVVADASTATPLLVHCAAGRDRTGVVIAAILVAVGIPDDLIIADYLMTDGIPDEENIRLALQGLHELRPTLLRFRAGLESKFCI